MNLDDYEAVWKRQELPVGATAELAGLKQTFEAKRRKLERTILFRNVVEGVGGVLGSIGFCLISWRMGIIGWPTILGAMLISGVSCVFLRDWLRFRRARISTEATLLAKLESNISELRHQRRLVEHIGKWYLTPYCAALFLFCYGFSQHLDRRSPPGFISALLTTPSTLIWIILLIATPTIATIWWLRDVKNSIRIRIEPRIVELEKLRADLLSSTD